MTEGPICPYCQVKLANMARWRYHLFHNACGKVPSSCLVPAGSWEARDA